MSQLGLGCAKTKSDLVVAEDKFLRFFALRMTTEPKIPGAVIPRRVFTQPGSKREVAPFCLMSASTSCGHHTRQIEWVCCGDRAFSRARLVCRPYRMKQN